MVASIASYSRYMRASMLEVVNSDYVRTARAKGLSERSVTMRHAFRNALIPLVTIVALNFGALLGGAVVTETVFGLDGMGLYFINALNNVTRVPGDGLPMVTATLVIVFNLVADIAYGYLDPRSAMTDRMPTSDQRAQDHETVHMTGNVSRPVAASAGAGAIALPEEPTGPGADLTLSYESGVELKARSQWAYARIRFFRHRLAVASLVVLILVALVAIFAKQIGAVRVRRARPEQHRGRADAR